MTKLGTEVVEKTISPADFVISEDSAMDQKEFEDFLRSVYDGRVFEQAQRLATAYERPLW